MPEWTRCQFKGPSNPPIAPDTHTHTYTVTYWFIINEISGFICYEEPCVCLWLTGERQIGRGDGGDETERRGVQGGRDWWERHNWLTGVAVMRASAYIWCFNWVTEKMIGEKFVMIKTLRTEMSPLILKHRTLQSTCISISCFDNLSTL